MNTYEQEICYTEHLGMMTNVLGYEATQEGEGVFPFLKAVRTWDPGSGEFSTWLWHNLLNHKRTMDRQQFKWNGYTVSLDSLNETIPHPQQPDKYYERKDSLMKAVEGLSEDGKAIVMCIMESQLRTKGKRMKIKTGTKMDFRASLKKHCRHTLHWGLRRYWKALKEVGDMVNNL